MIRRPHSGSSSRLAWSAALLALATAATNPLLAATDTWLGGSGEWTNPANWSSSPLFPNAPDDTALFLPNAGAISLSSPVTVGNLVFDIAAPISLTGSSTLTLATSSGPALIQATTSASAGPTLSTPLQLLSDLVIQNLSVGTSANTPKNIILAGPLFGTAKLTLAGPGEVLLRGNSTAWSPASIQVQNGALSTVGGSITSLGNPLAGTLSVSSGASVDISGLLPNATYSGFAKTLLLAGNGAPNLLSAPYNGALTFGATANTLLGPVILSGGATLYGKSSTSILNIGNPSGAPSSASLSGTGPLTKAGAGTLALYIPASHSGGTIVSGGTLLVSPFGSLVGTGTTTVYSGARLALSTPAGNSPALNAVSPNSVLLAGGTLSLTADLPVTPFLHPSSSAGILSLETGATFTAGGTNSIDLSAFPANSFLRLAASNGTILPTSLSLIPDASHVLRIGAGTGNAFLNASLDDAAAAPSSLDITAPGQTILLGGARTYTGASFLNAGNLNIASTTALGSPAGPTLINGANVTVSAPTAEPFTLNSGTLALSAAQSGAITLKGGLTTITVAGTSALTLSGGTLNLAPATSWTTPISQTGGSLALSNAGISAPLTLSAGSLTVATSNPFLLIATGGVGSITFPFSGTLALSGGTLGVSSTLTGPASVNTGGYLRLPGATVTSPVITLNGGRLALTSDFPLATILTIASTGGLVSYESPGMSVINNGSFDFSTLPGGSSLAITTTTTTTIPFTVTLKPDNATHTLRFGGGPSAGTITLAAPIADFSGQPTNLAVANPTTVILSATNNSYSGATTVDGTLQVNNATALGTGVNGALDGTTVNPTGRLLTATGVTLTTEKITALGGTLNLATQGALLLNSTANVTTIAGTFAGPISGPGNLAINGSATLSGPNTFTGSVTLLSGAVVTASTPSTFGDDATGTTLAGGTLTLSVPTTEPFTVLTGLLAVNTAATGLITQSGGTVALNRVIPGPLAPTGGTLLMNATEGPYSSSLSLAGATLQVSSAGAHTITSLVTTSGISAIGPGTNNTSTLTLAGGLSGSGTLTLQAGGTGSPWSPLLVSGPTAFNGTFNVGSNSSSTGGLSGGDVTFGNASLSGATVLYASLASTGTLSQSGNFFNKGSLNIAASSTAHLDNLFSSGTLTIAGNLSTNQFHLGGGSGYLRGAGTLNTGANYLEFSSGELQFTGTLQGITSIRKVVANAGPGAFIDLLPASFTGSIDVLAGALTINSSLTLSTAPVNVLPGAQLKFDNGTFANPVNLNGSSLDPQPALVTAVSSIVTATLTNAVNLGNSGAVLSGNFTFKGPVSGGALNQVAGTLALSSSANAWSGPTIINSALILQDQARIVSPSIVINPLATLTIFDNVTPVTSRFAPSTTISLYSGTLNLYSNPLPGSTITHSLPSISALTGNSRVFPLFVNTGGTDILTLDALTRMPGATLYFLRSSGNDYGSPDCQLLIAGQSPTPLLSPAFTRITSSTNAQDFLAYGANGVKPYAAADYFAGPESAWTDQTVPALSSATVPLSASRSVLALKLSSSTLTLGANTLNISSGGLIFNNSAIVGSAGSRLTAGGGSPSAELIVYPGGNGLAGTIDTPITDNPGPDGLYDPVPGGPLDLDNGVVSVTYSGGTAGNGSYRPRGANTYSGTTTLNGGILSLASQSNIAPGPVINNDGNITIINFPASFSSLTIRRGSVNGGTLAASTLNLESGTLTSPLVGSGALFKTTAGAATISSFSAFTGPISATGGLLALGTFSNSLASTLTNSLFIQNATVGFSENTVLLGTLTLGDNAVLSVVSGRTLTLNPVSRTYGTNATLDLQGAFLLDFSSDPFTDPANPSRHLNVNNINGLNIPQGVNHANRWTGSLTISAGATLIANYVNVGRTTLAGTLVLDPASPETPNRIFDVTLSGNSKIDLTTRTLILENAANKTASLPTVISQLQKGYNNGNWLGAGITSSTAAADPSRYTVAIVDNADAGIPLFHGEELSDASILLTLALIGDANLDNNVDLADYDRWYTHVGASTYSYTSADFNLDGKVDLADYNAWYSHVGAAFSLSSYGILNSSTPIPEPATFALPLLALLLCRAKRR